MRNRPFRPVLIGILALAACAPGRTPVEEVPADTQYGGAVPTAALDAAVTGAMRPSDAQARPAHLPATLFDASARLPVPELEHRGATALGLALRRLGPTQRVLMIGAHPDDENTAVLAELALGRGADVAYLSLTRGEGGQNLIGGELEEALGLIRTEELLAARRLDGAVQFFTRAYDFGFSRSAEETFRQWPRDSVLADVVAVVRAWRPDAIVSIFMGTPRDGHGHHQVAGILAREAYAAAADPARFPEQIVAGLRPHAATRFYQSLRGNEGDSAGVSLQTGALDPLLGRSHFQVAMASRSRHRSQDMGRAEAAGPQMSTLSAVTPGPIPSPLDPFAVGMPVTLLDRWGVLVGDGASMALTGRLQRYQAHIAEAAQSFRPVIGIGGTAASLLAAVRSLDAAYDEARTVAGPNGERLRFHIAAERADAARAAALALGVVLDVTSTRRSVSPGDTLTLQLSLWNGGASELQVTRLEPVLPEGWWAHSDDAPVRSIAPGQVARRTFRVHLPADARTDVPYFLAQPRAEGSDMYVWPADHDVRARPFDPPLLRGLALVMDGIPLEDAAEHVEIDPARGELREPVLVLPALTADAEPDVLVVPLDASGRPLVPPFLQHTIAGNRGSIRESTSTVPEGWRIETRPGADGRPHFDLRVPPVVRPGDYDVALAIRDSVGVAAPGYTVVDYAHIRPRLVPEPHDVRVRAFRIAIPRVRIGYVPGSGDQAPASIAALGLSVDTLSASAIASADLAPYDVILMGARAYEVAPELAAPATRARLERYVRDGGALIVQYNKYEFGDQGMALLPLTMSRPHDRVTDERAPVRLLDPSHPILSSPNRIGAEDFEGWVQERGLYFAHTWDDAYTPLLEMGDPGQTPQRGSLLAARMGRGWYVYTGLALFRQLPAGVPGAYRLLANLLALGAD